MKWTSLLLIATAMMATPQSFAEGAPSWIEKISMSGDVRIRHEYVSKVRAIDTAETHKERFRLRLGLNGQVNDSITAKVRLASSDSGSSISNNTTMTDDGSKKAVYIDVAAVEWKICESASTTVGKQDNPLRVISKSELIYDADYTPEGLSISTGKNLISRLAGFSVKERSPGASNSTTSTSEPDSWLLAGLAGYKADFSESMGATVGLGYHSFTAIKKNSVIGSSPTSTDFLGNSNSGGRYLHDYQLGEAFAELRLTGSGQSSVVYVDAIQNFAADSSNTGLLAGAQWQSLNEQGKAAWTLGYAFQTTGKDATLSAANNSDLNNGNDGGFAHVLTLGRLLAANTNLNLTVYRGEIDNAGNPYWIDRAHLDLVVNF